MGFLPKPNPIKKMDLGNFFLGKVWRKNQTLNSETFGTKKGFFPGKFPEPKSQKKGLGKTFFTEEKGGPTNFYQLWKF